MKKVRVLTAEEAALLVNDGDTIATGGFVSCACPEALSKALENKELRGKTEDGQIYYIENKDTEERCVVKAADGDLEMPAYIIRFEEKI